jgi:hypothetical protein
MQIMRTQGLESDLLGFHDLSFIIHTMFRAEKHGCDEAGHGFMVFHEKQGFW